MEIAEAPALSRCVATLRRSPEWIATAAILLAAEVVVIATLGRRPAGVVISNLIQVTLGVLCIVASWRASRRSGSLGSYFWRLITLTFFVWVAGQYLGFCSESLPGGSSLAPVSDLLFVFSTVPFGMALFLDPDHEPNRFDRLHILDFIQAILFWSAVYLFFRPLPGGHAPVDAPWKRNLVFDAVLTAGFLLRTVLTRSTVVRALFGRMLIFLCFSTLGDAYANYPGRDFRTGDWFDVYWSGLVAMAMLIAGTWNKSETDGPEPGAATRVHNIVVQELFPLLYPSLILVISSLALGYTPGRPSSFWVRLLARAPACFSRSAGCSSAKQGSWLRKRQRKARTSPRARSWRT